MLDFAHHMPTKILYGKNVVNNNSHILKNLGKKAFIITGRNSSKINGSLDSIKNALNEKNIDFVIFDEIEENPSVETIETASNLGKKEGIDFVIGIGGGSPIDAAKAIGVLINNPDINAYDIFDTPNLTSLPLIAIPTTAGTGTEVTPYAILTDKRKGTKRNFNQSVFPKYALIDPLYLMDTPDDITINTAIDSLSHLIEGYLSIDSNILSDLLAEKGFKLFADCIESLKFKDFPYEIREKLFLSSTLAGMVIAQSGTSLPHGMGYALTYHHNIPHGKANGFLLKEYLDFCNESPNLVHKVAKMLKLLDFTNVDDFGQFIKHVLPKNLVLSETELRTYTHQMISNVSKLKKHNGDVTEKAIYKIYINSLT